MDTFNGRLITGHKLQPVEKDLRAQNQQLWSRNGDIYILLSHYLNLLISGEWIYDKVQIWEPEEQTAGLLEVREQDLAAWHVAADFERQAKHVLTGSLTDDLRCD